MKVFNILIVSAIVASGQRSAWSAANGPVSMPLDLPEEVYDSPGSSGSGIKRAARGLYKGTRRGGRKIARGIRRAGTGTANLFRSDSESSGDDLYAGGEQRKKRSLRKRLGRFLKKLPKDRGSQFYEDAQDYDDPEGVWDEGESLII